MIRPLSYRIRVFYLVIAVLFFVVTVPLLIFYAFGYRFSEDWRTILETGGVHVWTGYPQTDVLIDGVYADRTSFLGRSIFVQNLSPETYTITAQKEGYRNWSQMIQVYGSVVTEVNALMVRNQNQLKLLSVGTTTEDVQVGDDVIAYRPQADIVYISNLLTEQQRTATSSPKTMMVATSTPIESAMYSVFRQGSTTVAYMPCVQGEFTGVPARATKAITPKQSAIVSDALDLLTHRSQEDSLCVLATLFDGETEPVTWFDFYPGRDDVLLVRTPNDLYAVEITNTAPRHAYRLYTGPGTVITDGRQVYVSIGRLLYEIEL